jgi:hypothetical protein
MNIVRLLIVLLLLALLLAGPVLAQISPHFDLGWHLLSGGGGPRSSTHYQVDDVLGQWPDGQAQSARYRIDPGFWHAGRVGQMRRLYLPVAFKART